MKKYLNYILGTFLLGFGLLTLFLSSSIILDLFNIREEEGNYVLFVVWANFLSSIIYLIATYGFWKSKKWTTSILSISTIILIIAFVGLIIHKNAGGLYETKTIGAMIFRISVTLLITIISYLKITKLENMKVLTISILTIGLFLSSCGNKSNQEPNESMESTSHEDHQNDDDADNKSQTIELNNGEKWKVNAEMVPFILDGQEILSKYTGSDYKALASQLKEKNSGLIKSCTMDGKSHDELHKWLHPHIELIDSLEKAENLESANAIIANLKESFNTYSTYFQ